MTILTRFTPYTPESEAELTLMRDHGIGFLLSAEGADWYQSQKLFKEDAWKVVFEWETGKIYTMSKDVSALWPNGACVADIDFEGEFDISKFQEKVFNISTGKIEDKVYSTKELKAQVADQIAELQTQVATLITPLQHAKDLEIITEPETAYLKKLQIYSVELHRVPEQKGYPSKVEWPVLPKK